jgi:uncharacterized membrane protein
MSDVLFSPIFKWPLLIAIAALVACAVVWSFIHGFRSKWRVAGMSLLRLLALAAFVFILIQPQRRRDEVTILRPQLAVLVDTSESMNDPADEHQPRRAERVKEWLRSPAIEKARKDFDVRVFSFDQTVAEQPQNPGDMKSSGSVSNLGAALNQVQERFRGQPLAGILLLSDGLDTVGTAKSVQVAAPVFTFELEKPFAAKERSRRISLANVDYPPRVVTGWDTEIRVSVQGSGISGQTVPVELWRDGKKRNETTVAFNEDEQTRQAVFTVTHDKSGAVQYEIRVPDKAADKDAREYPFVIQVLEPGNRVLYVQNTLGFDFKFLRKAIVTDRNLQLTSFVRWGDGRLVSLDQRGGMAKLDFNSKSLINHAVVILGDLAPDSLTAENARAIRDFVDRGGGLVLLGGPNLLASPALAGSPLGETVPVKMPAEYREGNFPTQITDTGMHHPVFGPLFAQVKDFPALLTCNVADTNNPTAEVLMETTVDGQRHPLVVSTRFGQGRVVAVLTDTIWRWRLAAKGWSSERSPYDTFWAQAMDWLIPKEQQRQNNNTIELFTERSNYLLGERPEVRAIVRLQDEKAKQPASLPLEVRTPDEKVFNYTLQPAALQTQGGRQVQGYRVEVDPNVAGVFRTKTSIAVGGVPIEGETRFVVTRPVTEITGKPIDRELLKTLAEANHGKFYAIENWNDWLADLHVEEQHFSRVLLSDLWNHPLVLGFLMTMLAIDWIARKRWNLP